MNLNKVFLIGRLAKDPELKKTPNGNSVVSFGIATNNVYTDKAGVKQETTEWHNIVAWGKLAETIASYMRKGSEIFIEGRITTRSYEDKNKQKRFVTEIVADRAQFGAKPQGPREEQRHPEEPAINLDDEPKQPAGDIPY